MRGAAVALAFVVLLAPAARAADPQGQGLAGVAAQSNGQPVHIEADNGIEWQQENRVYIARGNATATRGDDTVKGDTLTAYYRPTAAAAAAAPPPQSSGKSGAEQPLGGGPTEIYRLEADGHVTFTTPTQTLVGDHAVYDLDEAVLVATGTDLRLTTPRDTITARDSMEWYDRDQFGVARGNAVAVSADRRVRADVLTAHVTKDASGASRISRIDANGNVIVSSPDQIGRGDDGVYDLDTGIATLAGHVRLTRGENELRGRYAVVDLNTNVSRILSAPPGTQVAGAPTRVEGLIVPRHKPDQP